MYCNDCHEPTCVPCVTTTHKKHDSTDINSIIENLKRRIAADVEELENTIRPKYKQNFGVGNSSKEFEKVMNAIQNQDDNICKVVRMIGNRLRDEVATKKREFIRKNKSFLNEKKELNEVISTNNGILKSNDVNHILNYRSKIEIFRRGPKQMQISYSMFLSGKINQNKLQEMFGSLQKFNNLAPDGKRGRQKLVSHPIVCLRSKLLTEKRQSCGEF